MGLSLFFKRFSGLALFVSALTLIISCNSATGGFEKLDLQGEWRALGLADHPIHTLKTHRGSVYAGTEQGLYRRPFSDSVWTFLGLNVDSAVVSAVALWGDQNMLAGLDYEDPNTSSPKLFRSDDGGNTWEPIEVDFNDDELRFFLVQQLALDPMNRTGCMSEVVR